MDELERTFHRYVLMTAIAIAYVGTINNHSIKISKEELLKVKRKENKYARH